MAFQLESGRALQRGRRPRLERLPARHPHRRADRGQPRPLRSRRRRLDRAGDRGRRQPDRLPHRSDQPRRCPRHLGLRPGHRCAGAGLTPGRRRRRRRPGARLRRPQDQRRWRAGRLHDGGGGRRRSRHQRQGGRLRARPGRGHDDARQPGHGPDTAAGNGRSFWASLDRTGNRVAFYTESSDLGDGDTTAAVRRPCPRPRRAVPRPRQPADGPRDTAGQRRSTNASLSADGQRVVFESIATDLGGRCPSGVRPDLPPRPDGGDDDTRQPRGASPGRPGGDSLAPTISADGTVVAFESVADNLVGTATSPTFSRWPSGRWPPAPPRSPRAPTAPNGAPTHDSVEPLRLTADGGCVTFSTAGPAAATRRPTTATSSCACSRANARRRRRRPRPRPASPDGPAGRPHQAGALEGRR